MKNMKGALSGMIISMAIMCPIIVNTQYAISQGKLHYEILPTRIDGCSNETIASSQNVYVDLIEFHFFIL